MEKRNYQRGYSGRCPYGAGMGPPDPPAFGKVECHDCGKAKNDKYDCPYPSLAMVYACSQKWECVYDPDKALARGTMFAALDMPCTACTGGGCGT